MAENKHIHATRRYTGPTQFFHNFEHDPTGLRHCTGPASNPYTIKHVDGKNVIDKKYAKGHGKGNQVTAFKFMEKVIGGYLLASGEVVSHEEYAGWLKGGRVKP